MMVAPTLPRISSASGVLCVDLAAFLPVGLAEGL
jgi:hypothetical protein